MEQNGSSMKFSAQITTVSSINLESDIKVRRYDCKWTINNFRFCSIHDMDSDADDDSMESRHFDTDGLEWSLDLFPRGSFNREQLSVRLYYCSSNSDVETSTLEQVHATMSIIDIEGMEAYTQQKMITKKQLAASGFGLIFDIVDKCILYDEDNGLLPNNQLTLLCKIFINEHFFIKPDALKNAVNERRLIELGDFGRLLEDRKFSDVRIVAGDKTFHAHKAILSVRSSVFAAMFSHEMKEQKESKIEITDFDEEVIGQLLFFLYTGSVDLDKIQRLAGKLFAAADKYEITGLKMICEQALIGNLEIDNIAEVLQIVDRHGSKRLCEAAFEFLRKRRHGLTWYSGKSHEEIEAIFSSLSPAFLAKLIRSLMEEL